MELERLTLAADPRIARRRRQLRRRRRPSRPWPRPPASAARGRENGCYVVVSARWPTTATRPRPASASRVGRSPDELRPRQGRRARPPSGPPACSARPSRRPSALTVVLDPYVTAQFLGIIGGTLNGESVAEGPQRCSPTALGEEVASAARHARRRPHQPAGVHRDRHRRRGPGRAAQRADRRRRAAAVRAQQRTSARRAGTASHRQRGARRLQGHARRRLPGAAARCPGTRDQAELIADVDDGVLVQSVQGLHSGVNPISGDFSDRRRRAC